MNFYHIPIGILLTALMLFPGCDDNPDEPNALDITETNEYGELVGLIDTQDWSPSFYDNYYVRDEFWFEPADRMLISAHVNETADIPIQFVNTGTDPVSIQLDFEFPFGTDAPWFDIPAGESRTIDFWYISGTEYTDFIDTVHVTSSLGDEVPVEIHAYTLPEGTEIHDVLTDMIYPAYPNPVTGTGQLPVKIPLYFTTSRLVEFEIYDVSGTLLEESASTVSAGEITLEWVPIYDGYIVPNGFYTFKIYVDGTPFSGDVQIDL